jgi:nitrite reductase/ring-hydroxylating ferredoxin subunit
VHAGTLAELNAKGRLVVRGSHRPILIVNDQGRVYAFDNRCPHLGFPLDRGSVEDGILTCHWHHARFDLASGCTFDLWADDVPT